MKGRAGKPTPVKKPRMIPSLNVIMLRPRLRGKGHFSTTGHPVPLPVPWVIVCRPDHGTME